MLRACKVTLKFSTQKKRRDINALLESYRAAVNFFIQSLWSTRGKLDKVTLARLTHTRLSERYKSQALKQAMDIIVATKLSAKELGVPAGMPFFKGSAILDAKFVSIESGKGSFDLIINLSTLHKGHKIVIPTKKTAQLNKWLNRPLAELVQGCALSEDSLILWVKLPELPEKKTGKTIGVDVGVNKLLVDSDGNKYGTEFKRLSEKIRRKKKGSKSIKRAYKERDCYIDKTVKELPWSRLKVIGVEDLKDLKRGKKKGRGRAFRKAMAPWTYRRALERIGQKAQENRVHLEAVPPAYTSRECPSCGMESKDNRRGEAFRCLRCNYSNDSDVVGAKNVLARTLRLIGSVGSPMLKKAV